MDVLGPDFVVIQAGRRSFMFDGDARKGDKRAMNPKRWLPWLCVVMLLIGEAFLFNANRQKNAAQATIHDAEQQAALLQSQLDQLKLNSATEQSSENDRLRKENRGLSQKLVADQDTINQLNTSNAALIATNAQMAAELEATRELAQQLQQPQPDPQNDAMATLSPAEAARNQCLNNLRQIDAAKQQWALENSKTAAAVPTVTDLLPYFPNGFPACPAGGRYQINTVGEYPTCSIPGHVLTQ
jgi:hypothetical protein